MLFRSAFEGNLVLGLSARPTTIGRVLDDGSTQLYGYKFNLLGNITNSTDPVGRNFSYLYDTNNLIDLLEERMTHAGKNELLSRRTYNSQHRPLNVTDASGQTTINNYNARGQLLTTTNPKGEMTSFSYDTNGYLQTITGPLQTTNDVVRFTYDAFGRVRTLTDTEGYTLTFDYDTMDRRTRTTYPDGTFEQYLYDRLDLIAACDRLGRCTTYTHDALQRPTRIQDPLGRVTQYEWCRCGSPSSLIDPMGRQTTWQHDLDGRVTGKQYPDGSTVSYAYELSTSRLKSKLDEKGQQTLYEYNSDNNLARKSYLNAVVPTPNVAFTYDPDYIRPLRMQDGIGTTVYTYNQITNPPALGAGRLALISGPRSTNMISYQYDQLGRIISRAINGVATTTTYDNLGRPTTVANPLGAFQYAYVNDTARVASMAYPNGQTNLYSYYNNLGDQHLEQILHLKPDGSVLSSFGYGYDPAGEILLWTNALDGGPASAWTLRYDAASQLTKAVFTSGASVSDSHAYQYDPAGNRLQEQLLTTTNQYAYNALNQLVAGPAALTNATYEWDAENRLTAINQGNLRVECAYDGRSRRVGIRTLLNGLEITNRLFLWSGFELSEEHNSAGAVVKRFYPQGFQTLTGAVAAVNFYTRDHLGSVRELTDSTGSVVAEFGYDPYGQRSTLLGNSEADFGFAGQFREKTTGLSMTLFRIYNPSTGRWLSRDPLGGAEFMQGPNLYSYANNSPVNLRDRLGLDWSENAWAVGAWLIIDRKSTRLNSSH